MSFTQRMLAAVALAMAAIGAHAASLAILNPSFEDNFAPDGGFPVFPVGVGPTGWNVFDPNGIVNGNGNSVGVVNPTGTTWFTDPVPHGRNAALIFLSATPGAGVVGISQTLAAAVQANTRYTLSVAVGDIDTGTGLGFYAQFGEFNLKGFPGYRVELLAGGSVIAADDNGLAGTLGEGRFGISTVQVDIGTTHAAVGQPLGIRLINLNQPGTPAEPGIEVDFDNVQLVASAVPEPASYVLFGAGIVAVLAWRRRSPAASIGSPARR